MGSSDCIDKLSPIQKFYKDKAIFVTGGTGFLGKVIIEKLLRSCDIRIIYILIRSKKGKNEMARFEEIFDDPVFDRLKCEKPRFRHKIVCIIGDCTFPELGINIEDRKTLQQNVNIVFHVAATVRFDEKLRLALSINVCGTQSIIKLCSEMKQLEAFVHVSTAFANCPRSTIDEKTYKPPISGENSIKLLECLDDKTLDKITPQILHEWPNTYTFTKCLAEDLVKSTSKGIPTVIFRPAIVISTYREPIAGWIDNMYGPTGIIVGCGAGLLRVFNVNRENIGQLVPVDMCVNALLASAWDLAQNIDLYDEPPIYNYVTAKDKPLTWQKYCEYGIEHGSKMPMLRTIWYYRFTMTSSTLLVTILTFLYHTVPAFFMDLGLVAIGKKPRMLKIYRKIHKFCDVINYFSSRQWEFGYQNLTNLWNKLDESDKELFYFNMSDINWSDMINSSMFGIRTYLMKEDPKTIPKALKRMQWMKILHYFTIYTVYTITIYVSYLVFSWIFNY